MQSHVIVCQIRAFSLLAEMEAMKAENEDRKSKNQSQAYTENDFFILARNLEELAREAQQIY